MRVLMLGWEFPPFIAGGLGTACYGLTRAMSKLGHEVLFVLPKPVDRSHASHIELLSPDELKNRPAPTPAETATVGQTWWAAGNSASPEGVNASIPASTARTNDNPAATTHAAPNGEPWPGIETLEIPENLPNPYGPHGFGAGAQLSLEFERGIDPSRVVARIVEGGWFDATGRFHQGLPPTNTPSVAEYERALAQQSGDDYAGDMIGNTERYARLALALARGKKFDVIHAHDWMTYPAGLWLARASGKPLVVHVHSTEFDRSGEHVNQAIYDIERRGMHGAMRIIAVSMLTKSIIERRYGIASSKVDVIYNGIDSDTAQPKEGQRIESRDKIVLFLGRITMQKGPEYFMAAAKRVLQVEPDAKFVVAGSGDMAVRMIELAAELGIGHRVLFTGFLRGPQVDRIFRMAECYVMPSVSEPFGIAPLEAIRNDVPTIISKQSGVSEVLTHALKVDFWDIEEMANKIVAVLRHPPLGATLRQHGTFELRRLTWEGAATKAFETYHTAARAQRELMGPVPMH